jgi:hypothetical protein
VLFGVDEPAALFLQGGVFAGVTIAWICFRLGRVERPVIGHQARSRLAGSVALLGVSAIAATQLGPRLPFTSTDDRFVLRDQVEAPFDPSQYPSPLARFRKFDGIEGVAFGEDEVLFTVTGLPEGRRVPIRFAVMDSYDGFVWRAMKPGVVDFAGRYLRYGDELTGAEDGESVTLEFEMGALASADSVWIPTAGSPTALRFTGNKGTVADDLEAAVRFNRLTETAASPRAVAEGERWQVDTNLEPIRSTNYWEDAGESSYQRADGPWEPTETIQERLGLWSKDRSGPFDRASGLRDGLREIGAYNNGRVDKPVASGHNLGRLLSFLDADQPQGNDEQYAAAVAFLANSLNIPARVVLVFRPEADGPVFAKDADAIVEVATSKGWAPVEDITPTREPDDEIQKPQDTNQTEVQPPPPTTIPPPNAPPEESDTDQATAERRRDDDEGSSALARFLGLAKFVAIPLVLLLGPALIILVIKARRRRRRRTNGEPATRVAAAWAEIADLAIDLGNPVPPKATRREVARFALGGKLEPLADQVDATVFGVAAPDDRAATQAWATVDTVRKQVLGTQDVPDRIRALVSLNSLRRNQ